MRRLTIAYPYCITKQNILIFIIMCTYMMINAQPTYVSNNILSGGNTNVSMPADINQDGATDILVSSSAIYWLENDGNENFTAHLVDNITAATFVDFGDINQDGAIDIVATYFEFFGTNNTVVWYENDGNENFTKRNIGTIQGAGIFATDLDDNGTMDVVVGQINLFASSNIYWYDNDGSGNFTRKTINNSIDLEIDVVVADLDNDGDKDIVSQRSNNGKIVWLENNGSESFTRHELNNATSESLVAPYVDDLNGDGLLDIMATGGVQTLVWYENAGAGSFTQNVITSNYLQEPESIYTLDWDGDGDKDLVTTVLKGDKVISIWENDGNENFTRNDIVSNFPGKDVRPVDIDGDGDQDIIGGRNGGVDLLIACDGAAPTGFCANPTVELDIGGLYTFTGAELIQTSTDPCNMVSFVSANPAIVDCTDGSSPVQVTVTAQDLAGNTVTCTSNVTVEDNIPPVITCNDVTVSIIYSGGHTINYADYVSAIDNCSYSVQPATEKFFCEDIGEKTVTLTIIPFPRNDDHEQTCTVTVTVVDGLDPDIECSDTTIELDENDGTVTINVEDIDGRYVPIFGDYEYSKDNCGLVSLTLDQTDFDCSHIGDNTVILTGVDVSGNSGSCIATVTVVDAVAPTGVVCNNPTVVLDANGQYTLTESDVFQSATDACTVSFVSASPASVSCTDVGNAVQVTVTVQDEGGNTASCTSAVTVVDNTPPTQVLCSNPTVTLDANGQYTFTGSEVFQSGTDACNGVNFLSASPSSVDCADIASPVQVTVTAQDASGNTANCTSTVTVKDNIPLEITCKNKTVTANFIGSVNIFPTALLDEIEAGNCATSYETSLSPQITDCSIVGDIPVTVTVKALYQGVVILETASCISIVTVRDIHPPNAVCHDISVVLDVNGQATIVPEDVEGFIDDGDIYNSFDDCGGDLDFSLDISSFDCNDLGVNPVVLTVTDPSGNSDNCTATVTVEEGTSLPAGWQSADIGQAGMGNDYAYAPCSQVPEYTVTGGGNNTTDITTDNVAFSSSYICGDGSIIAKVESVDPNGYGGLMIRESMDAGAKQVSVFSNMTNNLRFESRSTTNGMKQINNFFKPSPIWLKLERQGDWVFAYYSTTGFNFQYVHAVYVPMQNCVSFGIASFTYMPGSQTEAVFSNVTITGDNGGFTENNPTPDASYLKPLSDEAGSTLHLFPNPNNGQFTLKMDKPIQNEGVLTIYSHYGQQLYQQQLEAGFFQMQIDLGSVPAGMYLLEYKEENAQQIVKKFMISE